MLNRFLRKQPRFYKTECLVCDQVIMVRWERDSSGKWVDSKRSRSPLPNVTVCPLCDSTRLQTFPINEKEYHEVNQKWDLIDHSQEKDDRINAWLKENT